jgi:hypothetical protein
MNGKVHQASSFLQQSAELLQAHQVVIDTWYAAWVKEQRIKADELLRRRAGNNTTRGAEGDVIR